MPVYPLADAQFLSPSINQFVAMPHPRGEVPLLFSYLHGYKYALEKTEGKGRHKKMGDKTIKIRSPFQRWNGHRCFALSRIPTGLVPRNVLVSDQQEEGRSITL